MNEPIRTQWQIRCAFNGFCKRTLKNEAINAHRDTKRQQLREVSFSDLSPQEEKQLYTYDTYFADDEAEKSFCVAGKEITAKLLAEMAPTKSNDRILPITEETLPYFLRQFDLIERQRELIAASGGEYYDNKLFIAKPDGSPQRRDRMSANFGQLIRHLEMPHIRFHDLRHTAATNMHQLTGDFYTVGEILGHTLKGIGMSLGISTNLEAVTAQYVDVRLERKKAVLETYHKALHPQKDAPEKDATSKDTPKKAKKRSSGMEL